MHVEDVARLNEMVITQHAEGIFHAVDDVTMNIGELLETVTRLQGGTLKEIFLEEARKQLGGFADHMLKDILVSREQTLQPGWHPTH